MEIFIHLLLCIKYLTKLYYKKCRIRGVKYGADVVREVADLCISISGIHLAHFQSWMIRPNSRVSMCANCPQVNQNKWQNSPLRQ